MTLKEITRQLGLKPLTPQSTDDGREITAAFASDLLSDVLANAPRGGLLITVQVHLNVIAVAVHAELAAVVFAAGRTPPQAVIDKAAQEGVALLGSDEQAFDIAGRLYALGLRGGNA